MAEFSLPIYAISTREAMEVSKLDLAVFNGAPEWLTTVRDDGRYIELFSSQETATRFAFKNIPNPDSMLVLELNLPDLIQALEGLSGVQRVAVDTDQPTQLAGDLPPFLEMLKQLPAN